MKFYHFTPAENTESIKRQGLKVYSSAVRYIDWNYNYSDVIDDAVFLTSNLDHMRYNMMLKYPNSVIPTFSDAFMTDVTIFEIDGDKLNLDKIDNRFPREIIYYDNIPPSSITNIWTISLLVAMTVNFNDNTLTNFTQRVKEWYQALK